MRFKSRTFFVAALLLAMASPALADTGTPLMWASTFQLLIGNALIGVFEAVVVTRIFKYPRGRAISRSILANYFSSFAGLILLFPLANAIEPHLPGAAPLYRWPLLMIILGVISWFLSIVLEWPFWYWIIRPTGDGWKKAWVASLIAQTASYALLVPWYFLGSDLSLYRDAHVQHSLSFVHEPAVSVYYINPEDGSVWRIKADGTDRRKVLDAKLHGTHDRLYTERDPATGLCDLAVYPGSATSAPTNILLHGFARRCAVSKSRSFDSEDDWMSFGAAADLRGAVHSDWEAWAGFWAYDGIVVRKGHGDNYYHYDLGLDVPFGAGYCRDPTLLPGDQLLFEMSDFAGHDCQVLILDLTSRKLSVLTMGRGPVAVIGDSP